MLYLTRFVLRGKCSKYSYLIFRCTSNINLGQLNNSKFIDVKNQSGSLTRQVLRNNVPKKIYFHVSKTNETVAILWMDKESEQNVSL